MSSAPRFSERDLEGKIVHVLMRLGKVKGSEIDARLGIDALTRRAIVERLIRERRVDAEVGRGGLRYKLAPQDFHTDARVVLERTKAVNHERLTDGIARVVLRDRVMKAIAADPGRLTVSRLGDLLDVHILDVAEACKRLCELRLVERDSDCTFRRVPSRRCSLHGWTRQQNVGDS